MFLNSLDITISKQSSTQTHHRHAISVKSKLSALTSICSCDWSKHSFQRKRTHEDTHSWISHGQETFSRHSWYHYHLHHILRPLTLSLLLSCTHRQAGGHLLQRVNKGSESSLTSWQYRRTNLTSRVRKKNTIARSALEGQRRTSLDFHKVPHIVKLKQ